MNKILSMVVPGYNIEMYIDDLMSSILASEYLNEIEVLIIDDGSTDCTKKIGDKYHSEYPDIVYCYSKENGGHGSTLNYGIPLCKGKYIRAIDGDDWFDTVELDKTIRALKNTEADIVATGYVIVNIDEGTKRKMIPKGYDYNKAYDFYEICDKLDSIEYHSIIYKNSIINKNYKKLDENCFYVDCEYILYPLVNVQTVLFLETTPYMYRVGTVNQSVNIKNRIKNRDMMKRVILSLITYYESLESLQLQKYVEKRINSLIVTYHSVLIKMNSVMGKKELQQFDNILKCDHKEFYNRVQVRIKLLRLTGYNVYYVLSWLILKKNERKGK